MLERNIANTGNLFCLEQGQGKKSVCFILIRWLKNINSTGDNSILQKSRCWVNITRAYRTLDCIFQHREGKIKTRTQNTWVLALTAFD